ncbi:MAG: hypothetical protein Q4A68_09535 [Anaerobiospirillum succiniciproducens]|uniref:hypothetical protein n=1 Tax=Anaerobiospirillum succiniciproducens TaxID=13335 RepID=UPI0026DBE713|nr:hypothetical protein [Anaerobiospirillum succiniciproducens]MDO4676783.1 hypothetical protein [Anaerobiospirillum succiniciproducens]
MLKTKLSFISDELYQDNVIYYLGEKLALKVPSYMKSQAGEPLLEANSSDTNNTDALKQLGDLKTEPWDLKGKYYYEYWISALGAICQKTKEWNDFMLVRQCYNASKDFANHYAQWLMLQYLTKEELEAYYKSKFEKTAKEKRADLIAPSATDIEDADIENLLNAIEGKNLRRVLFAKQIDRAQLEEVLALAGKLSAINEPFTRYCSRGYKTALLGSTDKLLAVLDKEQAQVKIDESNHVGDAEALVLETKALRESFIKLIRQVKPLMKGKEGAKAAVALYRDFINFTALEWSTI